MLTIMGVRLHKYAHVLMTTSPDNSSTVEANLQDFGQQATITGLQNIANIIKKNGLGSAIAEAAQNLSGVTWDKKEYAGGVAGMENTLAQAPEDLKELGGNIAAANAKN